MYLQSDLHLRMIWLMKMWLFLKQHRLGGKMNKLFQSDITEGRSQVNSVIIFNYTMYITWVNGFNNG